MISQNHIQICRIGIKISNWKSFDLSLHFLVEMKKSQAKKGVDSHGRVNKLNEFIGAWNERDFNKMRELLNDENNYFYTSANYSIIQNMFEEEIKGYNPQVKEILKLIAVNPLFYKTIGNINYLYVRALNSEEFDWWAAQGGSRPSVTPDYTIFNYYFSIEVPYAGECID
ncbi:hypothetical protein TRFO_27084 [Tritrichomonas foetus]|uniref:Uncharacterized protein n=1 Tax=Tritrichomonas foetus TaxID=1144522 RepID=A0A1J4K782_9EUKA|nr:hypothetical protein TRFO_27084 [Tritrichomonas foetus]|eukprot:OHT05261.1 hypothetical protein TRFO_27084 [Tritrichomonas foetus]